MTEEKIKAAYDAYVAGFTPVEEVHARHILVATEEEAKAIKAELDAGKPFEVLAMEKTTDPSGKQNGGDLGFFSKGMMVPAFESVAFTLEPGTISRPGAVRFRLAHHQGRGKAHERAAADRAAAAAAGAAGDLPGVRGRGRPAQGRPRR